MNKKLFRTELKITVYKVVLQIPNTIIKGVKTRLLETSRTKNAECNFSNWKQLTVVSKIGNSYSNSPVRRILEI